MAWSADWAFLDWVNDETAWIIAGICSFLGLCLSLYNIYKHIYNYTKQEQQLYIIRILFIVPLYAIVSFLSLRFHEEALYFEIVRDIYEAFVIYCFLILILGYVGGEANCVALISMKHPMSHPCPFCCLPKFQMNVRFLRFCKQSAIQFIVMKPVMAVISLIMLGTNHYWDEGYQIVLLVIYNISYSLALYGLLCFYMAMRDDIRAFSPVMKFFAVKCVVFATYWQSVIVSIAPGITSSLGNQWNDFILCCEMSLFAFIHYKSFPWYEFKSGIQLSKSELFNNTSSVLSFKDVFRDVYHNVMPTYQTYVIQHDSDDVDADADDSGNELELGKHDKHDKKKNNNKGMKTSEKEKNNNNNNTSNKNEKKKKKEKTVKVRTFMYGNLDDPRVHNRYMFKTNKNNNNSIKNNVNNSSNNSDFLGINISPRVESIDSKNRKLLNSTRSNENGQKIVGTITPKFELLSHQSKSESQIQSQSQSQTQSQTHTLSNSPSMTSQSNRNEINENENDNEKEKNTEMGKENDSENEIENGNDNENDNENETETESATESEYAMTIAVTDKTFEEEKAKEKRKKKKKKMKAKIEKQQKRKEKMDKFKDKIKNKISKNNSKNNSKSNTIDDSNINNVASNVTSMDTITLDNETNDDYLDTVDTVVDDDNENENENDFESTSSPGLGQIKVDAGSADLLIDSNK